MAALVLGLGATYVGGAIGATFGYAAIGGQIGWAAGSALGARLFGEKPQGTHTVGPMATELRITNSEYGQMIPRVIGHDRVAGQLWWKSDLRAIPITTYSGGGGGKGGGGQPVSSSTTYVYEVDLLIGLTDHEIPGISRIWWNGALVYNVLGGASAETVSASVNSERWTRMTVYHGTADQMPDPTYEADVGADMADAYRHRSYVFFEGLQLGDNPTLPQLTFEIGADEVHIGTFWNPRDITEGVSLTNQNLTVSVSGGASASGGWENLELSTGKWYFEVPVHAMDYSGPLIRALAFGWKQWLDGMSPAGSSQFDQIQVYNTGRNFDSAMWASNDPTGSTYISSQGVITASNTGASGFTAGDVLKFAIDLDNGKGWVGKVGAGWFNSGGPAAGSNPQWTGFVSGHRYRFCFESRASNDVSFSGAFGGTTIEQEESPPSGFTAAIPRAVEDCFGGWNPRESTSLWKHTADTLSIGNYQTNGTLFIGQSASGGSAGRIKPGELVYWEMALISGSASAVYLGVKRAGSELAVAEWRGNGTLSAESGVTMDSTGVLAFTSADRLCCAINRTSGKMWLGLDGVWFNSGNPATGANPQFSNIPSTTDFVVWGRVASASAALKIWLPSEHAHATPSGFMSGVPIVVETATGDTGIQLIDVSVEETVRQLLEWAEVPADKYDVGGLSTITKEVHGYPIMRVGPTRPHLEQLAAFFFFDCVVNDKLRFVPRGGTEVATIPYEDLGAHFDGEEPGEPFDLMMEDGSEIPGMLSLTYRNINADYNVDTQNSDALVMPLEHSVGASQTEIAMSEDEAKAAVNVMIRDQHVARTSAPISLLGEYARFEPADVLMVTAADDSTIRMRIVEATYDFPRLQFKLVRDDAGILTSQGITTADYTSQTDVTGPVDTVMELMDIPILRDEDDNAGFYVAAKGDAEPWPGAGIYQSKNTVDYARVATVAESAVIGTCSTVLGNWAGAFVFDETNSVTVDVGDGTLSSSTRAALIADPATNAFLVGSEIIQARTCTLQSPGVYKLTGLLRGCRGTEWARTGHGASERFVVLQASGVRRAVMGVVDLAQEFDYKGVTLGRKLSTATAEQFTNTGVALKPFSPVDFRVARDGSNNCTLTWRRRTRLAVSHFGAIGTVVPLGEDSEAYEVDIYDDDTYTTVVRTISATSETASYTAAQQTTDGLTPGDPIYAKVYQLSDLIGRGYELEAAA